MSKHPVVEYLDRLTWDGIPRIDTWLRDYAGAVDTSTTREASRGMLLDAVRRARHPGCKVDAMVVLVGEQGNGKSEALRVLAVEPSWFMNQIPWTEDPSRRDLKGGCWIAELSEFDERLERLGADTLKTFLAATSDTYRPPYARATETFERAFVIVGTMNSEKALRFIEASGPRCFRPVRVVEVDSARLLADRDQLWAEAAVVERDAGSFAPRARDLRALAKPVDLSPARNNLSRSRHTPDVVIRVDDGKYTFVKTTSPLMIKILRHGEPWHEQTEAFNAITSMMAELDSARVVLEAARKLGEAAPPEIREALAKHGRLVDDREPPSEWTR